jgi:hypothetical protein
MHRMISIIHIWFDPVTNVTTLGFNNGNYIESIILINLISQTSNLPSMNPEDALFAAVNKRLDRGVEEENRYCHRANTVKIL